MPKAAHANGLDGEGEGRASHAQVFEEADGGIAPMTHSKRARNCWRRMRNSSSAAEKKRLDPCCVVQSCSSKAFEQRMRESPHALR